MWKYQAISNDSQVARSHQLICCFSDLWMCLCPFCPSLSPLSSQRYTGLQLNSMVLHNNLELQFFFPIKFRRNRIWMFVMIWADLVKKTGSPIYLIQQHKSNMGLTLCNLSRPSQDTERSWSKLSGVKEWQNTCKAICHLHCYNCAKLMVPSRVSSGLALDFSWMFIFCNSPQNLSLNTHTIQKKTHSFTGRQDLKRYASEKSEKHSQFS